MDQYLVTGMSCAACQARVEKAVSKVPGVESCSVSLLTNSMGVTGPASSAEIIKAVTDAGYGASLKEKAGGTAGTRQSESSGGAAGAQGRYAAEEEMLKDHETPVLKQRLLWSLGFLLVLMYVSMGVHMLGWPAPEFLRDNHIAMGLVEMFLSGIILVINQRFFISGTKSVLHGAPNMDTLVAMGSGVSFLYSFVQLVIMSVHEKAGNMEGVMACMNQFYFESAAMILTLITVGKMLEARSKGKTTDALKGLLKLAPKTATVLREGQEVTIPAEDVMVGDLFLVRPGESVPVDGIVEEGESAVNEAALTGESIPVDKTENDKVSAATINQSGFLKCRATRVGEDTTLSQIIKMVSDAAATKAPIAKIADKVSGVFVPAVIGIAVITLIVWLLVGQSFGFALARSISVLVISCPCALGLATPVAIMVGNGMGAKNGILFKTAVSLEEAGKAQIVVLDKTGTITKGEPKVTDILPVTEEGGSQAADQEKALLTLAAALEKKSEHPLSKAIVQKAEEEGLILPEAEGFSALVGNGIKGIIDGKEMVAGSVKYIAQTLPLSKAVQEKIAALSQEGKTPLLFAREHQLLGIIAVADTIKEDTPQAIRELQGMGIRTVMLTGDNAVTAEAIGKQAGVDAVIAGVLPEGKESAVKSLQTLGSVVMVGDGINDAPALTRANIGMAIGAGTDVAIDAADVVLVKSSLLDAVKAIRLSRATLLNIYENLFWAFIYNIIGIPLAAGVWIFLNGWEMNPMFGAAAMSLSSFCVVSNALRLNLFRLHSSKRDRKTKKEVPLDELLKVTAPFNTKPDIQTETQSFKEGITMVKTTVTVEGMMCPMCEKHVNEAILKAFDVKSVVSDHTKNQTVIESEAPLDEAKVLAAINESGYQAKEAKTEVLA